MSFDEVAEEDEEIGQVRVFGRSLSLMGIDFWRKAESVFPDRRLSRVFAYLEGISFLNRDDARGCDLIAKGEAGCLARWCANGLEASRIVAWAV
tara:strand:- start:1972 stop:2253 length:282 start_codon:yes stop_codon:yes gene_type:complete